MAISHLYIYIEGQKESGKQPPSSLHFTTFGQTHKYKHKPTQYETAFHSDYLATTTRLLQEHCQYDRFHGLRWETPPPLHRSSNDTGRGSAVQPAAAQPRALREGSQGSQGPRWIHSRRVSIDSGLLAVGYIYKGSGHVTSFSP